MSFRDVMDEKDTAFEERIQKENASAAEVAVRLCDGALSSITEIEYEKLKTKDTVITKQILISDSDRKNVKPEVDDINIRTASSIIKEAAKKYIENQEREQAEQSSNYTYSYIEGGAGNAFNIIIKPRPRK